MTRTQPIDESLNLELAVDGCMWPRLSERSSTGDVDRIKRRHEAIPERPRRFEALITKIWVRKNWVYHKEQFARGINMSTSPLGIPLSQDAPNSGPVTVAMGMRPGAEPTGYLLVPIRKGADFS